MRQAAFLQMLAIELEVVHVCVCACVCTLIHSRVFHGGEIGDLPICLSSLTPMTSLRDWSLPCDAIKAMTCREEWSSVYLIQT